MNGLAQLFQGFWTHLTGALGDGLVRVFPATDYRVAWLGVLVCCIAGMLMSPLLATLEEARHRYARRLLALLGGVVLGLGIWTMDFTAMLAMRFPGDVGFDARLVAFSIVPAMLGCAAAFGIVARPMHNGWRVSGAALVSALGVLAMHYLGAESMTGPTTIRYAMPGSLAVVLTGVLFMAGGWYGLLATHQTPAIPGVLRPLGGALLGVGVAGIQFNAIAHTRYYFAEPGPLSEMPYALTLVVVACAIVLISLALLVVFIHRSFVRLSREVAEQQHLLENVLEQADEFHLIVDEAGNILKANSRVRDVFGAEPGELVGWPLDRIIEGRIYDSVRTVRYRTIDLESWAGQRVQARLTSRFRPEVADEHVGDRVLSITTSRILVRGAVVYSLFGQDITDQLEEHRLMSFLRSAVESSDDAIAIFDRERRLVYINPAAQRQRVRPLEDWQGRQPKDVFPPVDHDDKFRAMIAAVEQGEAWSGELTRRESGSERRSEVVTISPIVNRAGKVEHFVAISRDTTEQHRIRDQLNQAQKLESIGQLAAGIAHEINTPVQYVGDNIRYLGEAFDDLERLLSELRGCADSGQALEAARVSELLEDADVEFLLEEVPSAVRQSTEGVERVSSIVKAMKDYSHPGDDFEPADLNKAIRSTVTVARNEWKYHADLDLDLDEDLPSVPCVVNEVNQAVLNIVVNAAHAIAEQAETQTDADNGTRKGHICIRTRRDPTSACIEIEDDGPGMPPEVCDRVFEPFFTTKTVGKGTGQGLSIAYRSIVERHGGRLEVRSAPGEGTCFTISLPLQLEPKLEEDHTSAALQPRSGGRAA